MKNNPWPEHKILTEQLSLLDHNIKNIAQEESGSLKAMLQDLFQRQGKLLRGGFCLLSGWITHKNPQNVMAGATALEIFHLTTLIHDDIIDGAKNRRGVKAKRALSELEKLPGGEARNLLEQTSKNCLARSY